MHPDLRGRVVLLDHYDVDLARVLVQGCDVWLNTPLRPLEASGTSGMKAAANGALHASVMDGWWWEAYRPGLGWTIGRERVDDSPEVQDVFDAASLYELLEGEMTRAFYERDTDGVPRDWVRRMKASIAEFAPRFNTSRMVREYATSAYTPAAAGWERLGADGLRPAKALAAWLARVRANWPAVRVYAVEDDARDQIAAGVPIAVRARVAAGELEPGDLCVEAVQGMVTADGRFESSATTRLTTSERAEDGSYVYGGAVTLTGGGRIGYTIRVLPHHPDLQNPLATGLARWA
jgi:starch phosphorylase